MNEAILPLEHILTTLVGSSIGILLGGAAGFALARLLTRLYRASRRSLSLAVFVPWRTVLLGVLIPFAVPLLTLRTTGIGAKTGMVTVGIAVTGWAIAFTSGLLIRRTFPRSQKVELVSAARTLYAGAAALLLGFGDFGAGGLGFVFLLRIRILDFAGAYSIFLWILFVILLFDVSLGTIQYVLLHRELRVDSEHSTIGGSA